MTKKKEKEVLNDFVEQYIDKVHILWFYLLHINYVDYKF